MQDRAYTGRLGMCRRWPWPLAGQPMAHLYPSCRRFCGLAWPLVTPLLLRSSPLLLVLLDVEGLEECCARAAASAAARASACSSSSCCTISRYCTHATLSTSVRKQSKQQGKILDGHIAQLLVSHGAYACLPSATVGPTNLQMFPLNSEPSADAAYHIMRAGTKVPFDKTRTICPKSSKCHAGRGTHL